MIGVYDYTVVLTYLSTISGVIGIIIATTGIGHPYCGTLFLMISGLLDGFDGKVARTKRNRSDFEKRFGVQIDSLSDLICFGVLPASIGLAQLRCSGRLIDLGRGVEKPDNFALLLLLISIAAFYVLSALVRLAYFNSTEDERAEEAKIKGKEYFTGMPVTAAALVFPLTLVLHWFITKVDLTIFLFLVVIYYGTFICSKFQGSKAKQKQFAAMIVIGVCELVGVLLILFG